MIHHIDCTLHKGILRRLSTANLFLIPTFLPAITAHSYNYIRFPIRFF